MLEEPVDVADASVVAVCESVQFESVQWSDGSRSLCELMITLDGSP